MAQVIILTLLIPASNRSLNYAEGGSITRPEKDKVTIIPFKLKYKDTVGLFGKENHFIKSKRQYR